MCNASKLSSILNGIEFWLSQAPHRVCYRRGVPTAILSYGTIKESLYLGIYGLEVPLASHLINITCTLHH